jgi:hypothetical protein
MTIRAMRIVTTTGTYTSTIADEDRAESAASIPDPEDFVRTMSEIISATDKTTQNLTIHADGVGWVGLNTNYVVAVELVEDDA